MALVDAVTSVRKAARKVINTAIARGTIVATLEGDFYLRMRDVMCRGEVRLVGEHADEIDLPEPQLRKQPVDLERAVLGTHLTPPACSLPGRASPRASRRARRGLPTSPAASPGALPPMGVTGELYHFILVERTAIWVEPNFAASILKTPYRLGRKTTEGDRTCSDNPF